MIVNCSCSQIDIESSSKNPEMGIWRLLQNSHNRRGDLKRVSGNGKLETLEITLPSKKIEWYLKRKTTAAVHHFLSCDEESIELINSIDLFSERRTAEEAQPSISFLSPRSLPDPGGGFIIAYFKIGFRQNLRLCSAKLILT